MNRNQIKKLFVFNVGLIALELIVFSDQALGLSITGESTIQAALGITIIIMSIGIFLYGNYSLLTTPKVQTAYILEELREPKEYIEALESYRYKQALSEQIDFAVGQIHRLKRKKESLDAVLFQNYKENVDDIDGLKRVVDDTNSLLFENVKKILSRMSIFDDQEYMRLRNTMSQSQVLSSRIQIYNQHISYIKALLDQNESILLEFDNLLIEVSKLGEQRDEESEEELSSLRDIVTALKQFKNGTSEIEELEKKYQ